MTVVRTTYTEYLPKCPKCGRQVWQPASPPASAFTVLHSGTCLYRWECAGCGQGMTRRFLPNNRPICFEGQAPP